MEDLGPVWAQAARLSGYKGPFYWFMPELARAITSRLPRIMQGTEFASLMQSLDPPAASIRSGIRTSDGYAWWRVLRFDLKGNKQIVVAISTKVTTRPGQTHSLRLERMPAAYVKGYLNARWARPAIEVASTQITNAVLSSR